MLSNLKSGSYRPINQAGVPSPLVGLWTGLDFVPELSEEGHEKEKNMELKKNDSGLGCCPWTGGDRDRSPPPPDAMEGISAFRSPRNSMEHGMGAGFCRMHYYMVLYLAFGRFLAVCSQY